MYYPGFAYQPYQFQQFSTPRTIQMQQPIQYCTPVTYRSSPFHSTYPIQQMEKPLTIKIHMPEPEDNQNFSQYSTPFSLIKKQKLQQIGSIIPQAQKVQSIVPKQIMVSSAVIPRTWQTQQNYYISEAPKLSRKESLKLQQEPRHQKKQSLNFDINNFEKRIQALDNRLFMTLKQSKEFTHSVHKDMREKLI